MNIVPVNYVSANKVTSFKGYYKSISKDTYGPYYSLLQPHLPYKVIDSSEHPKEVYEAITRNMYPNSELQQTLGGYHDWRTDHVYFADPEEIVGDDIKKKVDFVVYDKEPKYPHPDEISTSFFGNDNNYYGKNFETIRDYYYRLEMADRRTLNEYEMNKHGDLTLEQVQEKIAYYKDRIAKSQYQQWQAQECLNKYNASSDLRSEKSGLESNIKYLKSELEKAPQALEYCTKQYERLSKEKEIADRTKFLYEKNIENYKQILLNNAELKQIDNNRRYYNEENDKKTIKAKIAIFEKAEKDIQEKLKDIEKNLAYYKNAVEEYPQKIKEWPKQIKAKEIQLADVKARLIPLFDELKHFYTSKRILG